jgi:hypothetical protein
LHPEALPQQCTSLWHPWLPYPCITEREYISCVGCAYYFRGGKQETETDRKEHFYIYGFSYSVTTQFGVIAEAPKLINDRGCDNVLLDQCNRTPGGWAMPGEFGAMVE